MDISTIKMPVEKTEGEQPHASTSQGSDPAFLQLLIGLGLVQPLQPNPADPAGSEKLTALNGGLSLGLKLIPIAQNAQAEESAATPGQEKMAVGKTQGAKALLAQTFQTSQNVAPTENLLAQVLTSAGKPDSGPTETVAARAVAVGENPMVQGKSPGTITPLPEINGAAPHAPQATISKDVPQSVLTGVMEAVSSASLSKERGVTPAVMPASIGVALNAAIPPSAGPDMPVKQMSTSVQTVPWDTVIEASTLPESGRENNSASSDHDGGKERFPQAEANGSQAAPAPVTSSFSALASPVPIRSAAAESVQAPAVAAPLESPLPASVRFEVQPGDMGRIRVHVSVVDHTVYTNVITERVEAHDFLVKGSERYEAGLAAHGLDVGRFQVDVQGQSRDHADRGAAWSQEQARRHRDEPLNHPTVEWQAEERKTEWEDRMVSVFA